MRLAPLVLLFLASFALAQTGVNALFGTLCGECHLASGGPAYGNRQFPPLGGRIAHILGKGGGREYLIRVVLWGLDGLIEINGIKYNGAMPPFDQLKDEEIAALLNHIATAWGNDKKVQGFKPFTVAEVKALREKKFSPQQMVIERRKLGLR